MAQFQKTHTHTQMLQKNAWVGSKFWINLIDIFFVSMNKGFEFESCIH